MSESKKVFLKTYGCQMNVYDSERMFLSMEKEGYSETSTPDDADLILLNTCHIREKAAEKVYSELGRLKHLKKTNPNLKIGVTGCVAQAEGYEIIKRQPMVDLVIGPQSYHKLPQLLKDTDSGTKAVEIDFPNEDKFDHLPQNRKTSASPSAFLTIQEGCDKFCAFCVVPYTRGSEVSRPADKIIIEAQTLADQGVKEITLLGQNVNAYLGPSSTGQTTLADLIKQLSKINELKRIRFTTSHPNDMSDDLIDLFATEQKLMPYLHLPVQSGSDKILKAMNRKHTSKSYIKLISKIREKCPELALSGDFIVGFPGETDEDFEDTMHLVKTINYAQAYSFKYSPRPGTPASTKNEVLEDIKNKRLQQLQQLLNEQQYAFQDSMIGKTLPILVERRGRDEGQLVGKSPYLHAVHFVADDKFIGNMVNVTIVRSEKNTLAAKIS